MSKTAIRRHHNRRIFFKRLEQNRRFTHDSQEWRVANARVRIKTGTLCSCTLCATPRKYRGNSIEALTWQERHAELKLVEGMDE